VKKIEYEDEPDYHEPSRCGFSNILLSSVDRAMTEKGMISPSTWIPDSSSTAANALVMAGSAVRATHPGRRRRTSLDHLIPSLSVFGSTSPHQFPGRLAAIGQGRKSSTKQRKGLRVWK
jgi:hypothetical protein